jgi:inorganic pyrophosphatase
MSASVEGLMPILDNEAPLLPTKFWAAAEQLVATSEIVIDRTKGSRHPSRPEAIYPVAYGYLRGTTAGDGEGIDVWVGSLEPKRITGVVWTLDLRKRDAELKLLLGCTAREEHHILSFLNKGDMAAILVTKDDDPTTPE